MAVPFERAAAFLSAARNASSTEARILYSALARAQIDHLAGELEALRLNLETLEGALTEESHG